MISNEILDIGLEDILVDANLNCRGHITPIDVEELARDIEKNGLLAPVVVQLFDKEHINKHYKWRLIAGFRRFTAHKILNRKTIKATVSQITNEKDARVLNLRENLQREDLNIMQEAKAIEHLRAFGMTMQDIAAENGTSITWVQIRLYLLQLPGEIQTQAAAGIINQHQIRDLRNLPSKDMQFEAVKKIIAAKERGDRTPNVRAKKSEKSLVKRHRGRTEIFAMMNHVQDAIGNNFGTRCLAWCAGEISDNAIYQEIRAIAYKMEKPYVIPAESILSLTGMERT